MSKKRHQAKIQIADKKGMNLLFYSILSTVCITAVFIWLARSRAKKANNELPYEKAPLLNEGEKNFYRALKIATKDDFLIFPKVRLIDILNVKTNGKAALTYKNKVNQKHIDFLLCDPESLEVKIAVELDGRGHNEMRQRNKDGLKNDVLKKIGLPLLRIQAKKSYAPSELQTEIKNAAEQGVKPRLDGVLNSQKSI